MSILICNGINIFAADDETATCPPPGLGVNAARRGHGRNAGDVVQFECLPEFPVYISGDEKITCKSNGAWQGRELECGGKNTCFSQT